MRATSSSVFNKLLIFMLKEVMRLLPSHFIICTLDMWNRPLNAGACLKQAVGIFRNLLDLKDDAEICNSSFKKTKRYGVFWVSRTYSNFNQWSMDRRILHACQSRFCLFPLFHAADLLVSSSSVCDADGTRWSRCSSHTWATLCIFWVTPGVHRMSFMLDLGVMIALLHVVRGFAQTSSSCVLLSDSMDRDIFRSCNVERHADIHPAEAEGVHPVLGELPAPAA